MADQNENDSNGEVDEEAIALGDGASLNEAYEGDDIQLGEGIEEESAAAVDSAEPDDSAQPTDEEIDVFAEEDYLDVSAIESELQVLLPNLTDISLTLVDAVELSTQNAKKLKNQENTLIAAFKSLSEFKKQQVKFSTIMLVTTGGVIAVALGLFLVAILGFSSKSQELSALNLALGKRIVELNAGLVGFEEAKTEVATLRSLIDELAVGVERSQVSYSESEQEIQGQLSSYSESLVAELTAQSSALENSFAGINAKVSAFESALGNFDTRLEQSDSLLENVRSNAEELLSVRDALEALLILERERYLDTLTTTPSPNQTSNNSREGEVSTASDRRDGEIYFGGSQG